MPLMHIPSKTSNVIHTLLQFTHCLVWLQDIRKNSNLDPQIILVANKTDLYNEVDPKIAREFAESNKMLFVESSAKNGKNVESMFRAMAQTLCIQRAGEISKKIQEIKYLKEKKTKRECCVVM
jgi:GTPase SAR1 family protein